MNDKEVKVEKAILDLNELKTQMYHEQKAKDLSPNPPPRKINTITNNFFRETGYTTSNQKLMSGTATSGFFSTASNFNPAGSLTANLENLDATQLRERLLVAETLMKKLYNRNKELENYHKIHMENGDKGDATPIKLPLPNDLK